MLEAESEGAARRTVAAVPSPALAIPASLQASLMARLDQLGPAKEVAQIGAAIGREFSHGLLAAVVHKPVAELGLALDGLIAAGLLFRQGVPPHATYLFKHALVQDAAYSTLLRSRRQLLHARIAATLEEQFPETAAAQPQLLAHHYTEAELAEKAIGYRLKAGRQSVTRSAMPEAVTQFQKGLELVALLPADARREEREFDLLLALSPALIATRAYSSSAVGEMIARARLLADRLGRSSDIVPLLYGQWGFYNNRSEHKLALSCAEQIEQIGRAQKSRALQMMGYMYQAIAQFVLGEFVTARALLAQCLGLSDPDHRATFAEITAEDPYVMTLSWLALTLAVLGYIERGRACIAEALSAAQQLEKAHSRVYSRCFALVFASGPERVANSPLTAKHFADELIALADEHGFPYLSALGSVNAGWSLIALGQLNDGLTALTNGLAAQRAMGATIGNTGHLVWRAQAYGGLGQPNLGFSSLAEAAAMIEATGQRSAESEMHRTRGDLLNGMGDQAEAELAYKQALAVARQQEARSYELQCAISLARLRLNQGKRSEGHDLLAPIYNWFTEGFDTPRLQEAKALLGELVA